MPATTQSLDQEVEEFRERIKSEAEELVLKKFPRYMLDLDKCLAVSCPVYVSPPLTLCFPMAAVGSVVHEATGQDFL